jgi:hypothetical protein
MRNVRTGAKGDASEREAVMAGAFITVGVEEGERLEIVARAAREKLNVSDYIRVRLGLRAQGTPDDTELQTEQVLRAQLADHELRLQALEARAAG